MNTIDEALESLRKTIVDLLKESIEGINGDDLGPTLNIIEYRNYLINNPVSIKKGFSKEQISTGGDGIGETSLQAPPNNFNNPSGSNIEPSNNVDFSNYKGGIISIDKLAKIFPNGKRDYMAAAVSALDKYGSAVGLTDKGKLMVLAQFAHESGNFIYTHEIGSGKGRKYGQPAGPYGKIYYGRGPIQITWESNYKQITENCFPKIGLNADIHKDPDLCCTNLEIGCAASLCWFMLPGNGKKAIAAANNGDVKALTKAINGGYNGLQDRINKTNKIFGSI